MLTKTIKWILIFCIISSACKVNEDCHHMYDCVSDKCEHKNLMPISYYDALGAICVASVSALANASGLGGGPLMTIILIVVFNFKVEEAVPLSQITVFSGTLIGTLMRLHLRHPTREKPAIDYELLVVVITPLLLGTTSGVFLSMIFPVWATLSLLTLVLVWITFEAARASMKSYTLENKEKTLVLKSSINSEEQYNITYVSSDRIAKPLQQILKSDKMCAPPLLTTLLVFIYGYNVLISLMRGSKYFHSIIDVPFCSAEYWVFTGSTAGFSLFLTLLIAIYLNRRCRKKINVGYHFDDCDMIWNFLPCFICVIVSIMAGIAAGLLSIGGGIIMSPIMYKLGLRTEVIVPTSSVLYVLTSSLAAILYVISGHINYYYALWVAGSAFIGSIIGIVGIKVLVNKYKRSSLMVISMTMLLALCTIIVPTYGIIEYTVNSSRDDTKSYCPEE
ncbi:hypothetical protein SteCoe_6048 [Stentor coeruleus]|uniref:Membrane transporter protein n=1 Tax=Stentor coeruleus TaxID=5963 RepID=A0A1R2CQT6_9CILI|nr:hypothetical protein SteCoe_6048 [Stentor coeruleus]